MSAYSSANSNDLIALMHIIHRTQSYAGAARAHLLCVCVVAIINTTRTTPHPSTEFKQFVNSIAVYSPHARAAAPSTHHTCANRGAI